MKWYWYLAQPREVLIDIDDPYRKTKRGGTFIQEFCYDRVSMAQRSKLINVSLWREVRSHTSSHIHVYLLLAGQVSMLETIIWSGQFGSDLYRFRADLMRHAKGIKYPSLLLEPNLVEGWRAPDAICNCEKKHVTGEVKDCDVWNKVRGMSPWQLFGRPLNK